VRSRATVADFVSRGLQVLVGYVVLAQRVGLETILGAFMAGVIVAALDPDTTTHPRFRAKLEGIGYGFVVPVFFITSGLQLELHQLLASPLALLRVPVFLVALLLVRGMPAVLYLSAIGVRASSAAALLQATSLPVIVTAAQIGLGLGALLPVNRGCADLRRCTVDANLSRGRACDSPTAGLLMVRKR
jgi:Kef-type K+ transport system membrane component KefB